MSESKVKNRVKECRKKSGVRQADLADQIGITRQTVIAVEQGRLTPSVFIALRMSQILNVKVEDLFWVPEPIAQPKTEESVAVVCDMPEPEAVPVGVQPEQFDVAPERPVEPTSFEEAVPAPVTDVTPEPSPQTPEPEAIVEEALPEVAEAIPEEAVEETLPEVAEVTPEETVEEALPEEADTTPDELPVATVQEEETAIKSKKRKKESALDQIGFLFGDEEMGLAATEESGEPEEVSSTQPPEEPGAIWHF